MLNGDRSQWSIEELRAEERAQFKRWSRVSDRAQEIISLPELIVELIDEDPMALALTISDRYEPCDGGLIAREIINFRARRRAEREIPPVSLQDIADELAGEVSHETE